MIAHTSLHVLETRDRACLLQDGPLTLGRPAPETSVEEGVAPVGAEHPDTGT